MSNFRGTREAQLIDVLEGTGKPEDPYRVISYVVIGGRVIGTVKETEDV